MNLATAFVCRVTVAMYATFYACDLKNLTVFHALGAIFFTEILLTMLHIIFDRFLEIYTNIKLKTQIPCNYDEEKCKDSSRSSLVCQYSASHYRIFVGSFKGTKVGGYLPVFFSRSRYYHMDLFLGLLLLLIRESREH